MSTISENAKAIFLEAVENHSPEGWPKFLDQACDADRDLRGMVEGLLLAHSEKDSLFDRVDATRDYQPLVRPGQMIGPYMIREQIGDGGMGVVYVAEQEKPLRRKVALKVIKPGMDSKAVLARFELERQALACMDHPNIAKVFDAGTSESGHPYFVMELIRGVRINEYCDSHKLGIRERLQLFIQVCQAVQHAHQKGIIHRDLKPSNVLVGELDGKPLVKVIDFGVAKSLHGAGADNSLYSGLFQAIGTLAYMSPEQAGLSMADVDTRSDVYALGVLLYELLTGTTPFTVGKLASAALDEAFRIIREDEPLKPSTQVSSLGNQGQAISGRRGMLVPQLRRLIQGDLDWITMKCLDKDRSRRYSTPAELVIDIDNFLNDREVRARPPSIFYRLKQTYRRHCVGALVLTLVGLLFVALGISGWSFALSLVQEQTPVLNEIARQSEAKKDYEKAASTYRKLLAWPRSPSNVEEIRLQGRLARCYAGLSQWRLAEDEFENAMERLAAIPRRDRAKIASSLIDLLLESTELALEASGNTKISNGPLPRFAEQALELSNKYESQPSADLYSSLARTQYEDGQFRMTINTCYEWLSSYVDGHLACLLLSASSAQLGNQKAADDWLLVADNIWVGAGLGKSIEHRRYRDDVIRLLQQESGEARPELSVEEEELLYAHLLERYPDLRHLRKYHGYCLFQLGRWSEALSEFDELVGRGEQDEYVVGSHTLLQMYFEKEVSQEHLQALVKRASETDATHWKNVLLIPAMVGDKNGVFASWELYRATGIGHVCAGLVLYRSGHLTEARDLLSTHGGYFPARDVLGEIILAMISAKQENWFDARQRLERAEKVIERLGPRSGLARTNNQIGYATSVIWLEPQLLLREAREMMSVAENASGLDKE